MEWTVNMLNCPLISWFISQEERFRDIEQKLKMFLNKQAGFKEKDLVFIPCSGLTGILPPTLPLSLELVLWPNYGHNRRIYSWNKIGFAVYTVHISFKRYSPLLIHAFINLFFHSFIRSSFLFSFILL